MKNIFLIVIIFLFGCANQHNQHLFEKDREKILHKNERPSNQSKFSTVYFISHESLLEKTSYLPIPPAGFALDQHLVALLPRGSFSQQFVIPGTYNVSYVHTFINPNDEKITEVLITNTKRFKLEAGREYFIGYEYSLANAMNGLVIKEYDGFEGEKLIKSLPLAKKLSSMVSLENFNHRIPGSRAKLSEIKTSNREILVDKTSAENFAMAVSHTQPDVDGVFSIEINVNTALASLLINDKEEGRKIAGKHQIKRIAPAGQASEFVVTAVDETGDAETKKIVVLRNLTESKMIFSSLEPLKIERRQGRDAVAIIIGISDYRSLPKAEFANNDARAFYDYANRALGIKPENIKLLVDGDAEEAEIIKAFRTWLPSIAKSTTDVYVYYSGHGLPAADGKNLYLLPPRADREVIEDTAIPFSKINSAIQLAKPRSVTIFLDACYSGQGRSGEALLTSARPVSLKSEGKLFPENFTVISASQNDQISSSSPDLKHGIFSYYLMKGMEGDADANRDGKITLGEMQSYLIENVRRQAGMMSRKQEPQLIGDVNRVLVGQ
jgi:hypothetical protein